MAIPILPEQASAGCTIRLSTGQQCERIAAWQLLWADPCAIAMAILSWELVCEDCRIQLIKERADGRIWICHVHGGEWPLSIVMREWRRIA